MQNQIQIALNELFSIRFDAILAPIEFWRPARLCTMSACYRILGCFGTPVVIRIHKREDSELTDIKGPKSTVNSPTASVSACLALSPSVKKRK